MDRVPVLLPTYVFLRYNEDQYVMRKTALYLFLIIVILPGLGLTRWGGFGQGNQLATSFL